MRPSFVHHLHPPTIPARQARLRHTLAAGGLAVFFSLVLLATGLLETFYYIPTTDQASASIQEITFLVPFGGLVRNLHFWAAQLLVVVTVLHLLRVVFTAAYAARRRFNYLLGMGLLLLAVMLDFTGYILRWDEGIHWALVTGTNLVKSIPLVGNALFNFIVGGARIGQATLIRFYGWHTFGLAVLAGILGIWHLFRVRRDGGIAAPPPRLRETRERITRFQLVQMEVAAILLASVALLLLATFVPAPLAPAISDSSLSTEMVRAPWFFLWLQELLKLGNPFFWGVVLPLAVFLILSFLPYLLRKPADEEVGHWFSRGSREAQVAAGLIVLAVAVLSILFLLAGKGN
jgi:quinol-cytochrome oxidoreductase complex cytochrome b subunit